MMHVESFEVNVQHQYKTLQIIQIDILKQTNAITWSFHVNNRKFNSTAARYSAL